MRYRDLPRGPYYGRPLRQVTPRPAPRCELREDKAHAPWEAALRLRQAFVLYDLALFLDAAWGDLHRAARPAGSGELRR